MSLLAFLKMRILIKKEDIRMGKGYYKALLAAAVLALAGCSGKEYEKIQGIEKSEENRVLEKQEDTGKQEENQEWEIVISDDLEADAQMVSGKLDGELDLTEEVPLGEDSSTEDDRLTLLFSGDVLLSDHVLNAYDKANGIHGVLDEEYCRQIEESDFFMVNQEFPFSDRGTAAEDKQYTFRLPPKRAALFGEMGIDGVTLANNHALDFGQEALLDSCQVLDGAGILHTGAGANLEEARRPVSVEIKGKRIAIIGATRVIPVADWAAGRQHPGMLAAYDMTVLLDEIRARRQDHDFVAVCIHWGIERDERPQEYQRTMARQMIDAGADLVVGSHPHVLQGMEYYEGKPIVYSLGNFVFGSSIPRTALLQVTWDIKDGAEMGEGEPVLRLIPGTSGAGYTRMLTEEDKRREFFRYMESISYGVWFEEDGEVKKDEDGYREESE